MSTAPWLDRAIEEIGVVEAPGEANNPKILGYAKDTDLEWKYTKDSIPWCATFINAMLKRTGYPSTRSALARSFIDYGMRLSKPIRGAIVVFPRGNNPLYGHVGIVDRVLGNGTIVIVNGNAKNQVKLSTYRISSILPNGIRWPPGAPLPTSMGSISTANDSFERRPLLVRGMRGPDVEEFQQALDKLDYMDNDEQTAVFGYKTENAVRAFQEDAGIEVDGKVGPATFSAMESELAAYDKAIAAARASDRTRKPAAASMGATSVGVAAAAGTVTTVAGAGERLKSLGEGSDIGLLIMMLIVVAGAGFAAFYFWRKSKTDPVDMAIDE